MTNIIFTTFLVFDFFAFEVIGISFLVIKNIIDTFDLEIVKIRHLGKIDYSAYF